MDSDSCRKDAAIFRSTMDERLNFAFDKYLGDESFMLQYIYKRFGVLNIQKVVRDCDNSDVPFYIGDYGDLSIKLCVGQTYLIFCNDDKIPLIGG